MNEPNIWIVGKNNGESAPWEFVGAFDAEAVAIDACVDASMFVGPAVLNQSTPKERHIWPGCYYPLAESATP